MQIDRYQHLQFPLDNTANSPGNDAAPGAAVSALARSQPRAVAGVASAHDASPTASVVLKIQYPGSNPADAGAAQSPVYSNARKAVVAPGASDGDADSASADHQAAVTRNAGVFTQITLDKAGVLVARTQPGGDAKQPDFVALAVSAMREFSDEADRQKARSTGPDAAPAEMPWTKLKGLQQLAARFNVFA